MHNKKRSVLTSNLNQSNGGKKLVTNVYEFQLLDQRPGDWVRRKCPLEAYWYVEFDSMSGDYTPEEISASSLLDLWVKQVKAEVKAKNRFPNNLIPIYWCVTGKETKIEGMPFEFNHFQEGKPEKDFLTFFTWPINSTTGEPLNWLTLPVQDKQWNTKRGDKGGFIQEATGWKPGILQPYVYLPMLEKRRA